MRHDLVDQSVPIRRLRKRSLSLLRRLWTHEFCLDNLRQVKNAYGNMYRTNIENVRGSKQKNDWSTKKLKLYDMDRLCVCYVMWILIWILPEYMGFEEFYRKKNGNSEFNESSFGEKCLSVGKWELEANQSESFDLSAERLNSGMLVVRWKRKSQTGCINNNK